MHYACKLWLQVLEPFVPNNTVFMILKKLPVFALFVFALLQLNAQMPGFNYQAVLRDNQGALMANHTATVHLSIHADSATGPVLYSERDSIITTPLGIFSVVVGGGTTVSGNFNTIDWSGKRFLQVELDANAGINYTDMGTSQLMSVPYALYAAKAPAVSVTVMDVNDKGQIWVGQGTDTVRSTNTVWSTGGNVGLGTPAVLGTTDNSDVVFKRNGTEAMRITADGVTMNSQKMGVGGGAFTPATAMDINGAISLRDTTVNVSQDFTLDVSGRSYFNIVTTVNGGSAKTTLNDGVVRGQLLLLNVSATGGNNIRVESNPATTNMRLSTSSRDMGDGDSLMLLWNGTDWVEINYTDIP